MHSHINDSFMEFLINFGYNKITRIIVDLTVKYENPYPPGSHMIN